MLNVTVDTRQLNELTLVLKDLGKGPALGRVLSRAVNRTAKEARTQIARTLRDASGVKYGRILDRIRIDEATQTDLAAKMSISHKRIPLIEFKAKQKAKGVEFKTGRMTAEQMAQSAFITTGRGGVKGVFIRRRADWISLRQVVPQLFAKKIQRYDSGKGIGALNIQDHASVRRVPRYPLDLLRGPSLWRLFSGWENLADDQIKKASEKLTRHVWEQVDLIVKRRKGAAA